MKKEKKRSFLRFIRLKLLALALILLGLSALADLSFRPVIETVCAYECKSAVNIMLSRTINEELSSEQVNYTKLVNLTTNENGEVTSVESNVMNINKLKDSISLKINSQLRELSQLDIKIPIGTLTGVEFLHNKGFPVGMDVQPRGYAEAEIISEFKSAGFNQTRHRILIEITIHTDAIIPGFSTDVEVKTTVAAAETIIVGKVPEAYTHVVSYDDDLIGTLQDYGATL